MNEATDALLDGDEPARWSLVAEADGQRFTTVSAVLDSARRMKRFPRALHVEWSLATDESSDRPFAAKMTGVLKSRPLVGFRLLLSSTDDQLREALAATLRRRLGHLDGADHSPATRPREAVALRDAARPTPTPSTAPITTLYPLPAFKTSMPVSAVRAAHLAVLDPGTVRDDDALLTTS